LSTALGRRKPKQACPSVETGQLWAHGYRPSCAGWMRSWTGPSPISTWSGSAAPTMRRPCAARPSGRGLPPVLSVGL